MGPNHGCFKYLVTLFSLFHGFFETPVLGQGCLDLPLVANGGPILYSSGTSGSRPIGTTATYSCNTTSGYFFAHNSGNVVRTCQSIGNWSGSAPSCGVPCPAFTIPNGGVKYIDSYGHEVYAPPGFRMTRPTNVRANINCSQGYTIPSPTRICQPNGTWNSSETTCNIPILCPPLSVPANGRVADHNRTIGSSAAYSCDPGYNLTGTNTRECVEDGNSAGQWTSIEPTCQVVNCGPLQTNLTNGMVNISSTTFNSTAIYTCDSAYHLSGGVTRTCEATGMWSGQTLTCLILCSRELISNGMVTYSMSEDPPPVGTVATYSCDTGYELTGNEMRTCEEGTGWSGSLPNCTIVDCGLLTGPPNGQVDTSSGTTFNQVATYSCDAGYNLSGLVNSTCQTDGVWSSTPPTCEFILFSIGETSIYTTNNSAVAINAIGEGSSALTCHTELTTCCREQDNNGTAFGEWRGPDSNQIPESNSASGFYVTRNQSSISLNRANNSANGSTGVERGGLYCCEIMKLEVQQTVCVHVKGIAVDSSSSTTDSALWQLVAFALVGLLAASLLTIVVLMIILIVMMRLFRKARAQRSVSRLLSMSINDKDLPVPSEELYEDPRGGTLSRTRDCTYKQFSEPSQCQMYQAIESAQQEYENMNRLKLGMASGNNYTLSSEPGSNATCGGLQDYEDMSGLRVGMASSRRRKPTIEVTKGSFDAEDYEDMNGMRVGLNGQQTQNDSETETVEQLYEELKLNRAGDHSHKQATVLN